MVRPAAIGMITRLARYRRSRNQYMRLRAAIAPAGVPGATANQPSPPRSRPDTGRSVVVSARRTSHAQSRASPATVRNGDQEAARSLSASPAPGVRGTRSAAPSGVIASALTAWMSCVGTTPSQSSDARKTPTGTTTTRMARTKSPESSRERRSRRNSEVSAMHTRASSTHVATTSTPPATAAIGAAPCADPHDRRAHGERGHGRDRDADRCRPGRAPPRGSSAGSPSTAKRRGSSGSVAPPISGARANPRHDRRAAEHGDRDHHLGLRHHRASAAPSIPRRSRRRAGRGPRVVRATWRPSPRSAPKSSATLSRRTCAATRGPPRR